MDFPLINIWACQKVNYALLIKKQTNKYKEKLQSIGIIVIKSNEIRVITYTSPDILVGI